MTPSLLKNIFGAIDSMTANDVDSLISNSVEHMDLCRKLHTLRCFDTLEPNPNLVTVLVDSCFNHGCFRDRTLAEAFENLSGCCNGGLLKNTFESYPESTNVLYMELLQLKEEGLLS